MSNQIVKKPRAVVAAAGIDTSNMILTEVIDKMNELEAAVDTSIKPSAIKPRPTTLSNCQMANTAKVMRGLNGCKKTETTSTVFGKMYKTNATSKGDARCS